MSYCRWSEGDVYVSGAEGNYTCMWCTLTPKTPGDDAYPPDFVCTTRRELLAHVEEHRARGDSTGHAKQRLLDEIAGELISSPPPGGKDGST